MLKCFDIIECETEVGFMEAALIGNMIDYDYFIESEEKSLIDKFIDKMYETIKKMKNRINEFITSATVKRKLEDIKNVFQKNPSLKNEKIKVKDYEKLDKLTQDTVKELETTKDVEATMEKYRKQRNKLLVGSTIATISLASAFVFVVKKKDEKIKTLEDMVEKMNKSLKHKKMQIQNLTKKNSELEKENKGLNDKLDKARARNLAAKAQVTLKHTKRDMREVGEKYVEKVDTIGAKAKAVAEVTSDASKDVINSVKDITGALFSNESPVNKIVTVSKEVKNVVDNTSKIVSGNSVDEKIKSLNEEARKLIVQRKRFDQVANNENRSDEDRQKAREQSQKLKKKINEIGKEISKLKN